jgi:hypothetical protein
MNFFELEVAKGNAAAAAHQAEIEAYWASPEGQAKAAEEAAEEAYAIALAKSELERDIAHMKAERRAENAALYNEVRAPYSGAVVARYRVR